MSGPFEQHAERLVERGYTVVPIIPGTKQPGFLCNGHWTGLMAWTTRFNSHASRPQERECWGRGNAGIGVLGGPPSQDLVAVDIDTEVTNVFAALLAVLPPTPVKKTGAKGETRFYYGPGIASQSWTVAGKRVLDIIGAGKQTVLPPSIHPNTKAPYRWLTPDTLEDFQPQDLPRLPADIVERITAALMPFGYQAPPSPGNSAGTDDDSPHRRLNDAALASLAAWVPALKLYKCRTSRGAYEAVPIWRPSSTGRPDQQRSRNLKISPKGIRDFGAGVGYTPIDLVIVALGVDLDTAFGFLSKHLGWAAVEPAIEIGTGSEADIAPAPEPTIKVNGGAGDEANAKKTPAPEPLEPYTRVPGAVGDVVDWIVSTARRPNRVLALGAAIVTIGTLIGRRVAGPTRSATHLYVVTVAPATSGKDHPRRCILPLLEAANAGMHAHLGDITSQSGFNRVMKNTPLSVVVIDEIAGFLGRITSPQSSYWERRLSGKLREQWSCSFGAIGTMTSAEYSDTRILCPAMSIFGTSTNAEFWSVLQGGEVENGFFSRFLVLDSNLQTPDQDPPVNSFHVPQALVTRLAELYCWDGNLLMTARLSDPEARFDPRVLSWNDRDARDCYRELTQWVERELDDDMGKQAYLGRVAETAIRLATIRAAGRSGPRARVDLSDMEWGANIAHAAITAMMEQSANNLTQTSRGMFVERLVHMIQRHGTISRRDLQRHVRGRYRTGEVNDMLNQAIEAGLIVKTADGYATRR
jgi:hypothetical protein